MWSNSLKQENQEGRPNIVSSPRTWYAGTLDWSDPASHDCGSFVGCGLTTMPHPPAIRSFTSFQMFHTHTPCPWKQGRDVEEHWKKHGTAWHEPWGSPILPPQPPSPWEQDKGEGEHKEAPNHLYSSNKPSRPHTPQQVVSQVWSSSPFPFLSPVKLLVPTHDSWKHVCITTPNASLFDQSVYVRARVYFRSPRIMYIRRTHLHRDRSPIFWVHLLIKSENCQAPVWETPKFVLSPIHLHQREMLHGALMSTSTTLVWENQEGAVWSLKPKPI